MNRCTDTLNDDRCILSAGHVETWHRGERTNHVWYIPQWVERARFRQLPAKALRA